VITLRNFVVHGYDEIDFAIVWNICERSVPGVDCVLRAHGRRLGWPGVAITSTLLL